MRLIFVCSNHYQKANEELDKMKECPRIKLSYDRWPVKFDEGGMTWPMAQRWAVANGHRLLNRTEWGEACADKSSQKYKDIVLGKGKVGFKDKICYICTNRIESYRNKNGLLHGDCRRDYVFVSIEFASK